MKIIADNENFGVKELFSPHGEVILLPAHRITNKTIHDADALIVRTVTPINEQLLENSRVRFVGSASAGANHFDTAFLKRQKVNFCYAPGCNALAVTDYILACLAALKFQTQNKRAGVIGYGNVGKLVTAHLEKLGMRVFVNDPPLGFKNPIPDDCDLITLHPSLVRDGEHPSFHLINSEFINKLKSGCVLINASRGEVINEAALTRDDITLCLDVWENEPRINQDVFSKAKIATPHIAGYSHAAKKRAVQMVYTQFCRFFDLPCDAHDIVTHPIEIKLDAHWQKNLLQHYNPLNDRFDPANFTAARSKYSLRDEIGFC